MNPPLVKKYAWNRPRDLLIQGEGPGQQSQHDWENISLGTGLLW